jgi:hypothetical protein
MEHPQDRQKNLTTPSPYKPCSSYPQEKAQEGIRREAQKVDAKRVHLSSDNGQRVLRKKVFERAYGDRRSRGSRSPEEECKLKSGKEEGGFFEVY